MSRHTSTSLHTQSDVRVAGVETYWSGVHEDTSRHSRYDVAVGPDDSYWVSEQLLIVAHMRFVVMDEGSS